MMTYYLKTNNKNELIINKIILLNMNIHKNEKISLKIKKDKKIIIEKINAKKSNKNFHYNAKPLKRKPIVIN